MADYFFATDTGKTSKGNTLNEIRQVIPNEVLGQAEGKSDNARIDFRDYFDTILEHFGTTFGSQLGALLGGDSLFKQIGARTLGSLIGAKISTTLGDVTHSLLEGSLVIPSHTQLEQIVEGAMKDAGKTITGAFQAQSFNALGSLLMTELADALNINGFEGQVLIATGGTVTGTLLNNVANDNNAFQKQLAA